MPRWIATTGRAAAGSGLTLALALGALVPWGTARAATGAELFLTEYVEGSGTNQAVEIYNPTDAPISLSAAGYFLAFYFDGDTTIDSGVPLAGIIQPGGTWVVTPTNASAALLAKANQKFGTSWFNGNDAVALIHSGTAIDVLGQIGIDPGVAWTGGGLSTADQTLRRKASIDAGDANGTDSFDPSVEWVGYPVDTFDGLGNVSERLPNAAIAMTCPSSVATVEGQAASASVSAVDPDGTVTGLSVTAVTPTNPGSIAVSGLTPASGPGVAATADLTVGAATPAGTYTATVTATNSDATPQGASCDVSVNVEAAPPRPPASLDDLRAMVSADVADGTLNTDKAGLLSDRIDRAAADLAAGRTDAYQAQLLTLGNQAVGLAPHWMSQDSAAALRVAANEVDASG